MRVDKAILREAADLLGAIPGHTVADEHWRQRSAAVIAYLDGLVELDDDSNPLGISDLVALGLIVEATNHGQKVTLVEGDRTMVGTARSIVGDERGNGLARGQDVRDGWLWLTMRSGFERFLPVMDVVRDMRAGSLALNYDADA